MEKDKFTIKDLDLFYGDFQALKKISMHIPEKEITAFIGPSGCGKSTLLKSLNRMNDLVEGCKITGTLLLDGDSELVCAVLTIFPAGEHKYIALLPLDENGENQDGEVFLYRFFQEEGQQPTLENIEDDDEYEIAADAFDELLDSAEYDEVVDGKEL